METPRKMTLAEEMAEMARVLQPQGKITDVEVTDVGPEGVTYLVKISVSNPYTTSIPMGEFSCFIMSGDRVLASEEMAIPNSLKASKTTVLKIGLKVRANVLESFIRDVGGDSDVNYLIGFVFGIPLPEFGYFTLHLNHRGPMKLPTYSNLFK